MSRRPAMWWTTIKGGRRAARSPWKWMGRREVKPPRVFTGSCPIREHTGDGAYVGRCDHATYDGYCPRHGALDDYPTNDDREVRVEDRRHA